MAGCCLLAVLTMGAACARSGTETKSIVKDCQIGNDQLGTVISRWTVTPVPVAFRAGQFSTTDADSIVSAGHTWNTFYASSKGFDLIDIEAGRTTQTDLTSSGVCGSAAILSGSKFSGNVKIYNRTSNWQHGDQVIALTTMCFTSDPNSLLKKNFNAIMENNSQDFYVAGKRVPDLESIFLHEFGHLFGLDHSCRADSTDADVPDCNGLPTDHPYFLASLFPTFRFFNGQGEEKRDLRDNDMGRANCLYQ